MNNIHPRTRAVHGGLEEARHWGAVHPPIYHAAAFAYKSAEELAAVFAGKNFGYVYSRIANPTVTALEVRLNALENGNGAIAVASGMAAVSTVITALTGQGDHIVAGKSLFGGTISLLENVFRKYGVNTSYVDTRNLDAVRAALTEKTRLVLVETLGNPRLDVPDVRGIAELCRGKNVPFVADCTLTPPFLFSGKEHGVSVVIHSTTKYITGNGSVIGGAVIDTGNFDWGRFRSGALSEGLESISPTHRFLAFARQSIHQNLGGTLSPFNAAFVLMGTETLALRLDWICESARRLADFFAAHPRVASVNYPGLARHPDHLRARHLFGGRFGGMLALRLGSGEKCFRLINRLRLVKNLANLGDTRTLIIHPASTIYARHSREERETAGAHEDLVRISVGLEETEDLINDFTQALEESV